MLYIFSLKRCGFLFGFYIFPQLLWVFYISSFLHVYSCIQYFVFWTSKNCQRDVIGPPALAGRVLWNWVCQSFSPSVRPSILPSFCLSGRFLGIVSLVFSKFWCDARNPNEAVRDRAVFSRKIFFAPKMDQKHIYWKSLPLIFTEIVL